jgi:Leucine-rich repeat (LRR) protein
LVYLDLSHNRLKTLPSQIGLLNFVDSGMTISCFLGDLIHLKRLYLESNFLKNLPYELGKLNLEDLGKNLIFKFSRTKKKPICFP